MMAKHIPKLTRQRDVMVGKEREQVRCKYRDSPRQIDRSEASYPL